MTLMLVLLQIFIGVARIVDGDTLVIDRERFRLKAIDAPELAQTCRYADEHEYFCGLEAKRTLEQLVGPLHVTCNTDAKDIYGRWLAICATLAQPDLGLAMVAQGWAVVRYRHDASPEMWRAQQKARAERIGLWEGSFEPPWEWRKSNKK